MKLTIFAKKLTSKEGRPFYKYLTTLTKKDGDEVTCTVKFREDAGAPKGEECPMNILVDKTDCNYREKQQTYEDKDGNEEEFTSKTLWISAWTKGEPYVDTSMDEFVD
jgi:hypothetical protein